MKRIGAIGESSEAGAMDLYGCIQMLAGQGRQNAVTILDASMPAPSLTGIYRSEFRSPFSQL